jgi:hypothetical protein
LSLSVALIQQRHYVPYGARGRLSKISYPFDEIVFRAVAADERIEPLLPIQIRMRRHRFWMQKRFIHCRLVRKGAGRVSELVD